MKAFAFHDYKQFLRARIAAEGPRRGYKGLVAKAAGCQPSYLSGVLNQHLDLTQDQLVGICALWSLDEDETDYLVLLLDRAKAASKLLRRRLDAKLDALRAQHATETVKAKSPTIEGAAVQGFYYGSWLPAAVHILASIPSLQTIDALATHLGLAPKIVADTASTLASFGLVQLDGPRCVNVPGGLHLAKDSPFVTLLHQNWRQRALHDASLRKPSTIHYTAVHSHAKKDRARLREILLNAVDATRAVVAPSANETMTCVCVDFFDV